MITLAPLPRATLSLFCLFASAPLVSAAEKIAVIPKGTTHVFWKSVEAGAKAAGQELGVEIIWKGPTKEDDRSQQIALVDQLVGSGINALMLAPLDAQALRGPVANAAAKKIPVVIFDSALKGTPGVDFTSYVATDNRRGGELAAAELARLLGGKGKVILLRYAEGSASTQERESGFLDALKPLPGIQVIVDSRYGGTTVSSAQDAAMNLLDKIREADGIFCPNESTTFGMLLALRQNSLAGKKFFVGFDTSPPLLAGLKRGDLHALVAQNPRRMGHVGVTTAVKALRGEKVEPVIDTGCALVTRENLDTPEIKALLGN
jgi:ribose transport system substrate-binding protein